MPNERPHSADSLIGGGNSQEINPTTQPDVSLPSLLIPETSVRKPSDSGIGKKPPQKAGPNPNTPEADAIAAALAQVAKEDAAKQAKIDADTAAREAAAKKKPQGG